MQKRILALLMAFSLCCSSVLAVENTTGNDGGAREKAESASTEESQEKTTAPASQPDAEGTLSYANLKQRILENNPQMMALEEAIAAVEALDYDKMYDDLRDTLNSIASAQWMMTIYGAGDSYTHDALGQTYASLEDTFQDLKDGKLQDDNAGMIRQLKNAQNQILMAAESLYVGILEMQNSDGTLRRSLDAMDRTVAEMELRYQRGQISALQLEQAHSGRTQLKSGLDTLETNIGLYTAQLENMVGLPPTGTLKLTAAPEIAAEQIDAMSYDEDLAAAKEKSYTLYDAGETLEDAKDDYRDAVQAYGPDSRRYEFVSAQHTWQAAQYTHQAAIRSFELGFQSAYTMVGDYRQVLQASETALNLAKNAYASMEVKYRQGNVSKNGLLDARDDLAEAEAAVLTARHNLFTAYRTYWWAVNEGVLN